MTGATPGPWIVEPRTAEGGVVIRTADKRPVAEIWHNGDDPVATGYLVAAAPDLLEALLDARAQLEAYEVERSGETFNDTRINAAIAKAEGL